MKITTRLRRGVLAITMVAAAAVAVMGGPTPTAQAADVKGFPKVTVIDLATGKNADLSVNNGGKLPTLAWFWAPS
jgi:hypothetical protein